MTVEFVNESTVELIQSNASDDMVAMAAWVSNGLDTEDRLADKKKVRGLINFLYREKHLSPFEHGQFTFKITTPIFVAREFHRHRTQSYNEMSGRYTEMLPQFYLPNAHRPMIQSGKIGQYKFELGDIPQQTAVYNSIQEQSTSAWEAYQYMKSQGVANEVARMVLPVNIMTQFYATVNPRNLMQFLDLRNADQALYEIRDVSRKMEEIFAVQMPMTWWAYTTNKGDK